MKRLWALCMAALLLLSLPLAPVWAEDGEPTAEPPATTATDADPTPEAPLTAEPDTPAPTEEPATPAPTEEPDTPAPTAEPETPAPTEEPAPQEPQATPSAAAEATEAPEATAEPTPTLEPYWPHNKPQWKKSLEYWERERSSIPLTGNLREDVLTIARSQLGYSADNTCYVMEGGQPRFYTRYGAWDGATYGNWCDSFVSFCIHFGGNETYPTESSCCRHMFALKQAGLWREWNSYLPRRGDIVFFASSFDNLIPSHVGLVEDVLWGQEGQPNYLVTIEGNQANPNGEMACVRRMTRSLNTVIGYGVYEPGKVYPQGYSRRSDGYQIIEADAPNFVEYPRQEVLDFLGMQNSPYYAYWFPAEEPEQQPAPLAEPEQPPAPLAEVPAPPALLKPERAKPKALGPDIVSWE